MANTFGLQSRKKTWEAAGDKEAVSSKLLEAACRLGGKVQSHSGSAIELKFGSRFNYRMLGVWTKPRNKPLVLKLNVESLGATAEVHAEALSDPGWYWTTALLNSVNKHDYEEPFRRIFDELQTAVPAVSKG